MKKLGIALGLVSLFVIAVLLIGLILLMNTDFNRLKPWLAAQLSEASGRELVIAGDLELQLSLEPRLKLQQVSLANAPWGSRQPMLQLEHLELQLQLLPLLKRRLVVDRIELAGLDLLLETDPDGQANWQFGKPAKSRPADSRSGRPLLPVVRLAQIERVRVSYRDGASGEIATTTIDHLQLGANSDQTLLELDGKGAINQQAYSLSGRVGMPNALASAPLPVDLKLDLPGLVLDLQGQIQNALTGKGIKIAFSLDLPNPAQALASAASMLPALKSVGPIPHQPMRLSGQFRDQADGYLIEQLNWSLGDNNLTGRLAFTPGGKQPRFDLALRSTLLDLDQLLHPQAEGEVRKTALPQPVAAQAQSSDHLFDLRLSDEPLPLAMLQAFDARLSFQGQRIITQGLSIEALALELSLQAGRLELKPLSLKLAEGQIEADLTLDSTKSTPALGIQLTAEQLDLAILARALGVEQISQGRLDLIIDLRGRGRSPRALLQQLQGDSHLELKQLALQLKNPQRKSLLPLRLEHLRMGFDAAKGPLAYQLVGSYGEDPFSADGQIGSLAELLLSRPTPLQINAAALDAALSIEGMVKIPLTAKEVELQLGLDAPHPDRTVKALAAWVPALKEAGPIPALPLKISGQLKAQQDRYSLDEMLLTLGNSDLSGWLVLSLEGERPAVEAELASNLLDIDAIFPPPPQIQTPVQKAQRESSEILEVDSSGEKAAEPAAPAFLFSKEPLPLESLKLADLELVYRAKQISGRGHVAKDLELQLSLKDGILQLKPLQGLFSGGRMSSHLRLDSRPLLPRLETDLQISQLDYGALLAGPGEAPQFAGKADLDLQLRGSGDSVHELMAGADGEARLVINDGRYSSGAIGFLATDLQALLPSPDDKEGQPINCGVAYFDIVKGQADARAIVFDTGALSLIGTGKIDLGREQLDLRLDPRAKNISVMKLTLVPLSVGGTLAHPTITPKVAGTLKTTATTLTALATGGTSLLVEALAEKVVDQIDETDYCTMALNGKRVEPAFLGTVKKESGD